MGGGGRLRWLCQWFMCHVFFVSWGKHWKGIYIHFLPTYCYRVFLWGADRHLKPTVGEVV